MSISSLLAAIIPVVCGLMGAAFGNIPVSLTGGVMPPPLLSFMAVYFWCLVRPDLMPPAAAFAVGLAQDLLSGSPPGFWTAAFIATYVVLDRQRESLAALAGPGAVLGFALAMLLVSAAVYMIAWVYFWQAPPLIPLILQVGVSVLCYVLVLPVLNGIQHGIVGALRSEF
jgi:rod shape-determining protein MreD